MSDHEASAKNSNLCNLRRLAAEFRESAAQTTLAYYSLKLRQAADEIDVEADALDKRAQAKQR
jgi:hypothetical protein